MRAATCLVVAALAIVAAPRAAHAGVGWQDEALSTALGRAKREGKLVFVDVYATWCGPCQEMDTDAYSRDEIARAMSHSFIPLRRDGERGEGLEIATKYHVVGFPTMLILDGSGAEIDRMMGGLSAADLAHQLERLKKRQGTLFELEKQLARAPTDALRLQVATRHAILGEAGAVAELRAVAAGDADNAGHRAANALLTLGKYYYLRGSKEYALAEQTLAELERRFPKSEEAAQSPYPRALAQLRGGRAAEARTTLDAWIAAAPAEADRYAAYAWFCFKESGDKPRGIEIAKKGLALTPNDDGMWDTLGELYAASGERAEAKRAFARAAEIAPKKDYYRSQLTKLGGNAMKWLLLCALTCTFACEREPAIVIRFDAVDLAGRDLARPPRDLAAPVDAAAAKAENDKTDAKKADARKADAKPECATDADCLIVRDGCCDCANGGKQHAVRKGTSAKKEDCKDVMCTMMMSTDPSCGKRPACVEHACSMRDARPDELKSRVPKR